MAHSTTPNNLFEGLTEGQQNAKLRERVLRFWIAAIGHPVVLKLQEKYGKFPIHPLHCLIFLIL